MLNNSSATTLINIELNRKKLLVTPGATILEVAEEHSIDIPTLCHDPRLEAYGSCWVCIVRVEGARGFVPACATKVLPGMRITTDSADIRSARKMALELLLSNHYGDCKPPCTLTCPSNIDVQGYIGLIANKKFREALELIKKDNPLPSVCGRVCPRPCEDACRRNLVDEAVGIDWLKRYVADLDLFSDSGFDPVLALKNGKRVAVVGGGPAGLSAAYYLVQQGVAVTIFEAEQKTGGMLRYGIPDYRLPQATLDLEINTILKLGVELKNGLRLGDNLELAGLRRDYHAVLLAMGAWKSRNLRVEGEKLPGVLSGIDFLKEIAEGKEVVLGKRIAVIGGGNTAIDAARTSLRLGAGEVYLFYRRTRNEMPAASIEIDEAIEEGVKISYLVAPVSIKGSEQGLTAIRLLKMELGEQDSSGRRRPIPVEGSEFDQPIDNVIAAIGQYSETSYLENLEGLLDERGYLVCNAESGETSIPGLFAAGDLVTGPDIAIQAIAGGKYAASSIMAYLEGRNGRTGKEFLSRKDDFGEVTEEELKDEPRIPLEKMSLIDLKERQSSFKELEQGYSREQALKEAARCLECGCHDVHECKLKEQAQDYGAIASRFLGEIQKHPIDESHPYIIRDPAKCILCGRCIRICLEVQGIGALGYIYRGFKSQVVPSFNVPFGEDELCISCGQCVSTCPVGALTEKYPEGKTVPLEERVEEGFCTLCSVACALEYRYHGTLLTRVKETSRATFKERSTPVGGLAGGALKSGGLAGGLVGGGFTAGGRLCRKGRFEHTFLNEPIAAAPLLPDGKEISISTAGELVGKYLGEAKKALILISPYLSGETIDLFLGLAAKHGMAVEADGLQELDKSWAELPAPGSNGGYLFEALGYGPEERVLILVGSLEESNNVAFTEALSMHKKHGWQLLGVARRDKLYDRFFSRLIPDPDELAEIFKSEAGKKRRLDLLINPKEFLKASGRGKEKRLIGTLLNAGEKVCTTLFWNSRNAGCLLRSLAAKELAQGKQEYDLMIAVGADNDTSEGSSNGRVIELGRKATGSGLFIPLPLPLWLQGYTEPSGRSPFRSGVVDTRILAGLFRA